MTLHQGYRHGCLVNQNKVALIVANTGDHSQPSHLIPSSFEVCIQSPITPLPRTDSLFILELRPQPGQLRVERAQVRSGQLAVRGSLCFQSVQLGPALVQLPLSLLKSVQHRLLLLLG